MKKNLRNSPERGVDLDTKQRTPKKPRLSFSIDSILGKKETPPPPPPSDRETSKSPDPLLSRASSPIYEHQQRPSSSCSNDSSAPSESSNQDSERSLSPQTFLPETLALQERFKTFSNVLIPPSVDANHYTTIRNNVVNNNNNITSPWYHSPPYLRFSQGQSE